MADRTFLQIAKAAATGENICGHKRECPEDTTLDSVDRDAAFEIPSSEVDVQLVVFESGGTGEATVVRIPGSLPVAERSLSGSPDPGRRARCESGPGFPGLRAVIR